MMPAPMLVSRFFVLSQLAEKPCCIVSKALCVAPALAAIAPIAPAKSAWPVSLHSASTVFSASTLPNSSAITSVLPPVLTITSARNPARPLLSSAALEKSIPSFLAIFAAESVGLMTLENAAFRPVMASLVPMPCLVSVAMDANSSSVPTFSCAASGMTLPMLELISPNVVLP